MKKYIILIALTVISTFSAPAMATEDITYEEIYHRAINNCRNRPLTQITDQHKEMINLMIDVEKTFNVPSSVRGMLIAAACSESGYNPLAQGDWRDRKRGKRTRRVAMAIGILQQWPWYERYYNIERTNPSQAAKAWMQHIVRQLRPVQRRCKIRSQNHRRLWVAAWVHAIRAPKPAGRCNEKPLHYKVLRRWHRDILKARRIELRKLELERAKTQEYIPGC